MKHIHSLLELRQVHDSILTSSMGADLANPEADRRHRFPVVRVESTLDLVQLMAGRAARVSWKLANPVEAIAAPDDRLHPGRLSQFRDSRGIRSVLRLATELL
jgi:hypothetical protein